MRALSYALRQAWVSLRRGRGATALAVTAIALAMIALGVLLLLTSNAERVLSQIDAAATFNYTPFLCAAVLFVALTIPLARFTDWLVARDRRQRLAGGIT